VDAVVTGHIGRKSTGVLKDAGIRILQGASGSVRDAVRMYREGGLTEI